MTHKNREGYEERTTKIMLSAPITDLSRLIGIKWFLGIERLSKETGVSMRIIEKALCGRKIVDWAEKKLRAFLEKL